jgi:polysaccharide export outer membrane protein
MYASPKVPQRWSRRRWAAGLLLGPAGLWLAGVFGCYWGRTYTAAGLPGDLEPPPVHDVQTLDLARLAGPPVANDRIECGDVIEVSITAALSPDAVISFPVRLGDDGTALLPEIGPVALAGLNLGVAEQAIGAACAQRGLYRQPRVTVTMRQQRLNRVTVVGAVKTPGVHELPRSASYLLAALVSAGGLADNAGPRVEIRCPVRPPLVAEAPPAPGPAGVHFAGAERAASPPMAYVSLNLAEAVSQGVGTQYLADGTVIMVQKLRPQPYQVIGLVHKPGEYEFPVGRDVRLLGAIAQAGGASYSLADKVYIIRKKANGDEVVIQASLERAKHHKEDNLRLQAGDVVSVEHNALTLLLDTIHYIPLSIGASVPIIP